MLEMSNNIKIDAGIIFLQPRSDYLQYLVFIIQPTRKQEIDRLKYVFLSRCLNFLSDVAG